jgi:hypothetical protein
MKIAQYEVLGTMQKRGARPVRDDRNVFARGPLVYGFTSKHPSIVPSGTGRFFERYPVRSAGKLRKKRFPSRQWTIEVFWLLVL